MTFQFYFWSFTVWIAANGVILVTALRRLERTAENQRLQKFAILWTSLFIIVLGVNALFF